VASAPPPSRQRRATPEGYRREGSEGLGGEDDMLTPTGHPPSRHGPQHTQHTASTAATPRYPTGQKINPRRGKDGTVVCVRIPEGRGVLSGERGVSSTTFSAAPCNA